MIDFGIHEKIKKLRDHFKDADSSTISQITQWENDIARLSQISDFVNLAPVQVITKLLKERIKSIMVEKASKGTNDVLDAREKELRYILGLFSPQYQSELSTLESLIDNELI